MVLNSPSPATSSSGYLVYGKTMSSRSEDSVKIQLRLIDKVTLSQEGKERASRSEAHAADEEAPFTEDATKRDTQDLSQLQQLKLRDTEVRTHEQAHLSAAGQYARGGASFTYQKGPDGGSYAVAGEVNIDVTKEPSPEATIAKMQTVKRAALAPANPSGADRRIAAQANVKEAQARQELLQIQQEEFLGGELSSSGNKTIPALNNPEIIASTYGSLKSILGSL
ncbi:MAG: putative metalloprotease CJM1_0395 family protein [Desulforhopalus sp.]